jgi:hypothetical protein
MAELTIICERPDSIQRFITDAITKELTLLSDGIRVTEERLREFETKYKLSTQEFLGKFSNDELHHSPDFDEWIGESRMWKRLQANARELKDIKIVVSSDYMMEQSLPINQLVR